MAVLLGLFLTAFVRTAWVAEDAFITFRVLDNLANGYGITWNPGERVQVFTHPLWFLVLVPFFLIGTDPFFTSLALNLAAFLLTLLLFLQCSRPINVATLAISLLLLSSRSFIDYSSSGLENPLVHALIASYLSLIVFNRETASKWHWHVLFSGLIWLARPDAIIPILPLLASSLANAWHSGQLRSSKWVVATLPAVSWGLFALFYFGSPIPNTALAKVATALDTATKFQMATDYFVWTFRNDLATILLITSGIVAGAVSGNTQLRLLSLGLLCWLVYLFAIGADYMGGRFLSTASVIAAFTAARVAIKPPRIGIIALSIAAAIATPSLTHTAAASSNYHNPAISPGGIADERGFYYPWLGLLPSLHAGNWQTHLWFAEGTAAAKAPGLYIRCTIGMFGFSAGPHVAIIDPYALTDSFLARLPSKKNVRPGHFERDIPNGYIESISEARNDIHSPMLRSLYDDVRLARQGDLFDLERLSAIVRLNTGDIRKRNASADTSDLGMKARTSLCPKFGDSGHVDSTDTWRVSTRNHRIFVEPAQLVINQNSP